MAPKKSTKKKTPRKKVFKRTKKVNPSRTLSTGLFGKGIPDKLMVTHRYVQTDTMTCTAGSVDFQTYSCNSMFDPDVTGTGHQPLYFDQMAALYNHYVVIGSKISIQLVPSSGASTTVPCAITLQQHSSSTPVSTNPLTVGEQNYSKVRITPAGMTNNIYLVGKWSAKKVFGGDIIDNDSLQGSSAAAPAEQSYWTVSAIPVDLSSTVSFSLVVTIDYISMWRELKTVAQS